MIRQQAGFVWRLLRRIGLRESETELAFQDVFDAASQRISDIRVGSERAFLFSTALHAASRLHRERIRPAANSEGNSPDLGTEESSEPFATENAPALEDLDPTAQAREILGAILQQMPLELRVVFVLSEIEQLSEAEIADVIGIPQATVATRLHDALDQFASHLDSGSELSKTLLAAARVEQPTPSLVSRALKHAGISRDATDHDPSRRATSERAEATRPSVAGLALKWLLLGFITGLVLASAVYALSGHSQTTFPLKQKTR